jgi:hypothetical protein
MILFTNFKGEYFMCFKVFTRFINPLIKSLIFSSVFLITACGGGGGGGDSSTITPTILNGDGILGTNTWTIMVYMDGDNNLEANALQDINEMELVNLENEGVKVIVLIDRCDGYSTADGDWKGTRLYEIKKDLDTNKINSTRLADSTYLNLTSSGDNEELNMGAPATVTKFISFCKNSYSADKYAFIFWNHGGGWRSRAALLRRMLVSSQADNKSIYSYINSKKFKPGTNNINKAVCWDETSSNDCLYMSEVESALSGNGINVIGFDACLMSMVEVVYQLKDCGDYVVASSPTEPASGWVYNRFLYQLINLSDNSSLNLSKCIVDSYIDYTEEDDITLSVIDLSKVNSLASAISTFATNLQSEDADDVCIARYDTYSYSGEPFIDLYHFAENLSGVTGSSGLITALTNAVVYHRHRNCPDSHGLSIYFPVHSSMDSEYANYSSSVIDFPGAVTWDEFLTDYYSDAAAFTYTIETFPNSGSGSSNTDTYLMLFTSSLNYIVQDDDSGTNYLSKITVPLVSGETYYLVNIDAYGATGPYSILCNIGGGGSSTGNPLTTAYEPNGSLASATELSLNIVQDHYLTSDDEDYFKIIP